MTTPRICSVDGCGKRHQALGYCAMHRKRLLVHGDINGGKHYGEPERYYQDVVLAYEGPDCLIWPFARGKHGYAEMRVDGPPALVHRRLCEEVRGAPPSPTHEAAHSCNRGKFGCVTKGHLRWATHQENMDDQLLHGTRHRGERSGRTKLKEVDIPIIRSLIGTATYAAIGEKFGVSAASIWQIEKGRAWGWLQ